MHDDGPIVWRFAANCRLDYFAVSSAHCNDQVRRVPDQNRLQPAPLFESFFDVFLSGLVGLGSRRRDSSFGINQDNDCAGIQYLSRERVLFLVGRRKACQEQDE